MKRCVILLCGAIFSILQAVAQQDVDALLRQIGERDQQVRMRLAESQQRGQVDSLLYYAEQIVTVDAENQAILATILKGGVPEGLSQEAYRAIFLVVDHAELDFQKRYFKQLKRASEQSKISRSSICTLYDRMMMYRGRRQRYGTQTQMATTIVEGEKIGVLRSYVWPVRGAKTLDRRREEQGMSTMKEQAEAHLEMGYEMVWDSSLSVRKFRQMMQKK